MHQPQTQPKPLSKPVSPAPSGRMALKAITKGRQRAPMRVLLYGVEGVGKSTFGSASPDPVFLGPEDGTGRLEVARFPVPETWADVMEAIQTLTVDTHEYRTLVIDTLDWLEPLLWRHVCEVAGEATIESFGYGKGYQVALDGWRVLLAAIERLRAARGMAIVLLAHCQIRPFKNPEGDDYDRYELKLNAKAGGLLKEWVDAVLFANHETFAQKDAKTKRVRGLSTGARLIYTQRTGAYDAKNRDGLPESLPLSWEDFWAAVEAGQPTSSANLREEIERKAAELGGEHADKARAALGRAGNDGAKLAQLNNWLNAKLAEKGA